MPLPFLPLLVGLGLGYAMLSSDGNKSSGAPLPLGYEERGGVQYVSRAGRGGILAALSAVGYAPQAGYTEAEGGTVLPTAAPPASPAASCGAWAEREAKAGRYVLIRSAAYPAELRSVSPSGFQLERPALAPGGPWGVLLEPGELAQGAQGGSIPGIPGLELPTGAPPLPPQASSPALPWLPPSGDFPKPPATPGELKLPGLDDLSQAQQQAATALLSDSSATPEQFEAMAELVAASSPKAAEALRALAVARRAAKVAGGIAEGRTYTVKNGSWPAGVAAYYTGDGARYRELVNNPANRLSHGGPTGVLGWDVGKVLVLPADWPKKPEPTTNAQLLGGKGNASADQGKPLSQTEVDAIADRIKGELDKQGAAI